MVTLKDAKALALSLPDTDEHPHFERMAYRVKKKIFMTLDSKEKRAVFKFSENDQSIFSSSPGKAISPIPNKWGQQGWTFVDLNKVGKKLFKEAMIVSWCTVAPKKLVSLHFPERVIA